MDPTINQVFHPVYINRDLAGVFFCIPKTKHARDWFRLGARSIQPKFPEISVQNSGLVRPNQKSFEKLVHLLRWTRWTTFNRSDQGGKRLGGETSTSEQKGVMQSTGIKLWTTDQRRGISKNLSESKGNEL